MLENAEKIFFIFSPFAKKSIVILMRKDYSDADNKNKEKNYRAC